MNYPDFFDAVPRLTLRDPLSEFLAAFEGGVVEYGYVDAVKLAGHSCPTVASAYWMTVLALRALYGDDLPERGAIRVDFREHREAGVTGVVANVVSLLTGATADTGFKGLGRRFDRRHLLGFEADLPLDIRYTRTDTGARVDAAAHLRQVPADAAMAPLMQHVLSGAASSEDVHRFGRLWQDRVRRVLLEHAADPEVFIIRRLDD